MTEKSETEYPIITNLNYFNATFIDSHKYQDPIRYTPPEYGKDLKNLDFILSDSLDFFLKERVLNLTKWSLYMDYIKEKDRRIDSGIEDLENTADSLEWEDYVKEFYSIDTNLISEEELCELEETLCEHTGDEADNSEREDLYSRSILNSVHNHVNENGQYYFLLLGCSNSFLE
jgi:hypothetical protein